MCTTAGSPYYNPHIQRPATFPPIDGYQPPEDPLRGVARQIDVTGAGSRQAFPDLRLRGIGVQLSAGVAAQRRRSTTCATGCTDFVGLGRMVLSYPELPADVLAGPPLKRKAICRTFSDCTTGPRKGLVSGCYPLDPFYMAHPDAFRLKEVKAGLSE